MHGRGNGQLPHRHRTLEGRSQDSPPPRQTHHPLPLHRPMQTPPRTHLQHHPRLGKQSTPKQSRTRPHHPLGNQPRRLTREPENHLQKMQPGTRRQTRQQENNETTPKPQARRLRRLVTRGQGEAPAAPQPALHGCIAISLPAFSTKEVVWHGEGEFARGGAG